MVKAWDAAKNLPNEVRLNPNDLEIISDYMARTGKTADDVAGDIPVNDLTSTRKWLSGQKRITELLVDGKVPSVINNRFNDWFDKMSVEDLNLLWSDSKIQKIIKDRIRHPGGLHEWCMVCETPKWKSWKIPMEEIKRFRTDIPDLTWEVPNDVPSIGGQAGKHGGTGSTRFHNEL